MGWKKYPEPKPMRPSNKNSLDVHMLVDGVINDWIYLAAGQYSSNARVCSLITLSQLKTSFLDQTMKSQLDLQMLNAKEC